MARTSKTMLNNSGKSEHTCLVPEEMLSVFHHWEGSLLWICHIWPLLYWSSFLLLLLSCFSNIRLCVTPIDGSPPGSPIPGILQARTVEWVAIFFSNAWKWKVKVKLLSHVWLLATPWTAAYQLLHPWDFPGKSTGVGCHCLLWK